MAYFGRFPYVFERYGLTDRALARQPVGERGRPGHERGLLRRDMIDRRVHFFIRGKAEDYTGALDEAVLGELLASIVRYDRALMDSIQGRPAVRFVDYPVYLDSLVQHATQMTPAERRNAWAFADGYYFQHNIDPVRYERTRQALFSE
jgi:hypothetical protein